MNLTNGPDGPPPAAPERVAAFQQAVAAGVEQKNRSSAAMAKLRALAPWLVVGGATLIGALHRGGAGATDLPPIRPMRLPQPDKELLPKPTPQPRSFSEWHGILEDYRQMRGFRPNKPSLGDYIQRRLSGEASDD